ncbi:MAG TPA: hypothetical protein VHI53_02905 [Gaiellaceae bacterium]|jgi:uncharacterized protein CbrC (UPF0167 family)|nr:hypothetical protein [Gaiellaceae bacterium]
MTDALTIFLYRLDPVATGSIVAHEGRKGTRPHLFRRLHCGTRLAYSEFE